jgi:hypothetical protein
MGTAKSVAYPRSRLNIQFTNDDGIGGRGFLRLRPILKR